MCLLSAKHNYNIAIQSFMGYVLFINPDIQKSNATASFSVLPDMTPAAMVDVMGDFLSLMWDRKEKRRPSRAMAKIIRGRGNMEPNRLW